MAQWAGTEREERDEQGVMNNREKEGECGFDRKETSESILPSHRDTHTRTLIHATKTIPIAVGVPYVFFQSSRLQLAVFLLSCF